MQACLRSTQSTPINLARCPSNYSAALSFVLHCKHTLCAWHHQHRDVSAQVRCWVKRVSHLHFTRIFLPRRSFRITSIILTSRQASINTSCGWCAHKLAKAAWLCEAHAAQQQLHCTWRCGGPLPSIAQVRLCDCSLCSMDSSVMKVPSRIGAHLTQCSTRGESLRPRRAAEMPANSVAARGTIAYN